MSLFSHEAEINFLKYIQKLIRFNKENQIDFSDSSADTKSRNALIEIFENINERNQKANPKNPYFGYISGNEISGYIGEIGISTASSDGLPESHLGIYKDLNGQMVVSYEARMAERFYLANSHNSYGLRAKRRFAIRNGVIERYADEIFEDNQEETEIEDISNAPVLDDFLSAALDAPRTNQINSIASTMSAEQYKILQRNPSSWIGLQGGPGTGKSVVALQRLSMISARNFQNAHEGGTSSVMNNLLFVAPTQKFLSYAGNLLPGQLGKADVVQKSYYDIFNIPYTNFETSWKVKEFKSDPRMLDLAWHAVWDRMYPKKEITFSHSGLTVNLSLQVQLDLVEQAKNAKTYEDARKWLTDNVFQYVFNQFSMESRNPDLNRSITIELRNALRDVEQFKREINFATRIKDIAPVASAVDLHKRLFTNPSQLRASWRAVLSEDFETETPETWAEFNEVAKLVLIDESKYQVSDIDVPFIFIMDNFINGNKSKWDHIVVDEVQDRCPLELKALSFLLGSSSGITILGDLAQSTEPWFYPSWAAIWNHINDEKEDYENINLEYSYRVPQDILNYAQQFRNKSEVQEYSIEAVKDPDRSGFEKIRLSSDSLVEKIIEEISKRISDLPEESTLCIITSREDILDSLQNFKAFFNDQVSVLDVIDSKGLEYDMVIIVDPKNLVDDEIANNQIGLAARKLWIAYTRATKQLLEINIDDQDDILDVL